ncbi:hypothetical protein LCGC14_1464200 [marine sediment metagenome]|uniref:Uncharacterized protein n=1 Tax=marine sediment metagenome TaxID=412755 RepID=A0A0F9K065_9ZZZZ
MQKLKRWAITGTLAGVFGVGTCDMLTPLEAELDFLPVPRVVPSVAMWTGHNHDPMEVCWWCGPMERPPGPDWWWSPGRRTPNGGEG